MPRRVEKHLIKSSSPWFPMLKGFCHLAKNLYNHANYIMRHQYMKDGKIVSYEQLDIILKTDTEYPDYRAMPGAQAAQQTLRVLCKNWKGFRAAKNDYKKHPEKYLGRPKMPKYKKKNGLSILTLTNQNCKLIDGRIQFPPLVQRVHHYPEIYSTTVSVISASAFCANGDGNSAGDCL